MPTTNDGITEMNVMNPVIARSTQVVRSRAARTPKPKPNTTPITSAKPATERLTRAPWPSSCEMSAPLNQLVPSRPCSTPLNQSAYCTRNGRSSPQLCSIRATFSGVADSPSCRCAGLSPESERSANVTNVATKKTGTKIATERAKVARARPAARRTRAPTARRRVATGKAAAGAVTNPIGTPPVDRVRQLVTVTPVQWIWPGIACNADTLGLFTKMFGCEYVKISALLCRPARVAACRFLA